MVVAKPRGELPRGCVLIQHVYSIPLPAAYFLSGGRSVDRRGREGVRSTVAGSVDILGVCLMNHLFRPLTGGLMLCLALLTALPLWAGPIAWETHVDAPSLQIRHADDAVHGLTSGKSCPVARDIYAEFGGKPERNFCPLALEAEGGIGFFSHCDAASTFLVRIDLNSCDYSELEVFRDQRLTGTAMLDRRRGLILFSHLGGTWAFSLDDTEPAGFFRQAVLYSKREFYSDEEHLYLLDTASGETPRLHRIDLERLGHTRVELGPARVEDFQRGRILLRSLRDGERYGVYDVRERELTHRWRVLDDLRPYFLGQRWVGFWKGPRADDPGEWTLVDLRSGNSVFHASWSGRRPPSLQWRDDVLFAGSRALLTRNNMQPVAAPVRQIKAEE